MNNPSIWSPFREMETLLGGINPSTPTRWVPTVDIDETDSQFIVRAELPGIDKSEVSVSVENRLLTIRGEKKVSVDNSKRHRVECAYGEFTRQFSLPRSVDAEAVEAKFKDGVLTLTVPKSEKAAAIDIKVN